jgi:MFS family permease
LGGAALAFAHPAFTGLLPHVVAPADRQQANAGLSLVRNGGRLIGAPLGGLLAAATSPGWALAVDAATYLVSAACWAVLRVDETTGRSIATSMRADLAGGWAEVRSRTWLWVVLLQFALLVGLGEAAFDVLAPVVARDRLGGASAFGVLLAVEAAGAVAGGVIALRLRLKRPMFAGVAAMALFSPELLLLAAGAPFALLLPAAALAGLAVQLFIVVWDTALQDHIPPQALSRVAAYDAFGSTILLPVGLAVMGPLAAWIGVGGALVVGAAGVVVPTLAALCVREVRTLPRVEHARPAHKSAMLGADKF